MDKTLVIYDLTGRILSITYGAVDPPQGVPYVWCDMPIQEDSTHSRLP